MLHNSEKDFIKRHIGLSKADEKNMLSELGYKSLDDLIKNTVPNKILLKDMLKMVCSIYMVKAVLLEQNAKLI